MIPKPPQHKNINQICVNLTNKINSKYPILVGVEHELLFLPKMNYQSFNSDEITFHFRWTSDSGVLHKNNYNFSFLTLHSVGEEHFLELIWSEVVFGKLNEWLLNDKHRISY